MLALSGTSGSRWLDGYPKEVISSLSLKRKNALRCTNTINTGGGEKIIRTRIYRNAVVCRESTYSEVHLYMNCNNLERTLLMLANIGRSAPSNGGSGDPKIGAAFTAVAFTTVVANAGDYEL